MFGFSFVVDGWLGEEGYDFAGGYKASRHIRRGGQSIEPDDIRCPPYSRGGEANLGDWQGGDGGVRTPFTDSLSYCHSSFHLDRIDLRLKPVVIVNAPSDMSKSNLGNYNFRQAFETSSAEGTGLLRIPASPVVSIALARVASKEQTLGCSTKTESLVLSLLDWPWTVYTSVTGFCRITEI